MKYLKLYISCILIVFFSLSAFAQQNDAVNNQPQNTKDAFFEVRGLVKEEGSREAIEDVNIQVNGGA